MSYYTVDASELRFEFNIFLTLLLENVETELFDFSKYYFEYYYNMNTNCT